LNKNIREAFFVDFAAKVRARVPNVSLIVTSGFKSRLSMKGAIEAGATNMVGVARAAIVIPEFPQRIFDESIPDAEAVCVPYSVSGGGIKRVIPIKAIGAGLSSVCLLVSVLNLVSFQRLLTTLLACSYGTRSKSGGLLVAWNRTSQCRSRSFRNNVCKIESLYVRLQRHS
jgi:hypothetical protein